MIYLLSEGSYADYGVIGIVEGPETTKEKFSELFEEYSKLRQAIADAIWKPHRNGNLKVSVATCYEMVANRIKVELGGEFSQWFEKFHN